MNELKAKSRKELGRGVKPLRNAGFLPAVVYGEKIISTPISVSAKDFEKVYKSAGESTLVRLNVEGNDPSIKAEEFSVLIHDIQHHPVKGHAIHADFYAVRMDKEIRIKVKISFIGESPAVKNEGGVLVKVTQELEVEALPQNLPHELKADISALTGINSRLLVKDIALPSKEIKVLANSEEVIALVEAPRSEEELESLKQAPVAEAPTEVKTEREVKKELEEKTAASEQPPPSVPSV